MARRYQRISADCHLDMLWLPPDLFTSNASEKLKDLMPYVAENSDGVKRWTDNAGAEYGLCGGVGATGTPHVPGKQLRADKMAEAGLYSDYFEKGMPRPGDPLWEAVNETQLPLHFHTFPATDPELRKSLEPSISRRMTYSGLVRFQMTLATILTDMMGAAVFERFPNIRMVLGESGIGWIPYVIDRMDFEYKDQYQDLKLKKLPSEYWRNQCRATFQYDRIGTKLIEDMGVETLMWGSDFPHPDGVWPESKKYIDEQFAHLPADVTYKMTCENAGKFYGLIN